MHLLFSDMLSDGEQSSATDELFIHANSFSNTTVCAIQKSLGLDRSLQELIIPSGSHVAMFKRST
jgi:hypothetical protein